MDLSAVGMRLKSIAVLEKGTVVEGKLLVPDEEPIPLKGEVIWLSPPDHGNFVPAEMGLELVEVPDAYLKVLARLFAD